MEDGGGSVPPLNKEVTVSSKDPKVCPECGSSIAVEYIRMVVVRAPIDPATGEPGRGRRVEERLDDGAEPTFRCSSRTCKWTYQPPFITAPLKWIK